MDSELVLLILLAIGFFWYFKDNGILGSPIPSIGNHSGSSLIGPTYVVSKEAANTGSYFKSSNTGGTGGPSTSTPPNAENYILPITNASADIKPYYKKSSPAYQKTCIKKGC